MTSFVTPKEREYTLRRCEGTNPHLLSFLPAVGGGRFLRLINRIYIILHVKFCVVGKGEDGSSSPVCIHKRYFQGRGIAVIATNIVESYSSDEIFVGKNGKRESSSFARQRGWIYFEFRSGTNI